MTKRNRYIRTCILGFLLTATLTACGAGSTPATAEPPSPPPAQPAEPAPAPAPAPETPESVETVWGIDTASIVDATFYACVRDNYGEPAYVGRYLETKEGVSYGIQPEEVELLHGKGVKILPIYNHFTDATTYERGVAEAEQAIAMAREAGIPEGVAIFADVEPNYPVDPDFLRGWTETMAASPYVPGLYGVIVEASESGVRSSYLSFAWHYPELAGELAVWTSDVDFGISTKANAPAAYEPEAEAITTVDVWQYGIDAETCNIDTNLMRKEFMQYLW